MLKRVLLGLLLLLLLLVGTVAALLVWQPRALQQKLVDFIADQVATTTPYQLKVESVSGNFFRRFTLHGVHIRGKGIQEEIVTADGLQIAVSWMALLQKHILVRRIRLEHPVVRLTLDKNRQPVLPVMPPTKKKPNPNPMPLFIRAIEIRDGRLELRNESISPPATLKVAIDLSSSMNPSAYKITELRLGVARGTIVLSGQIGLSKVPRVDLQLRTQNIFIHELLAAFVARSEPLYAVHTGRWTVDGKGTRWKLTSRGVLDDAALFVQADVDTQGPYKAHVDLAPLEVNLVWRMPALAKIGTVSAKIDAAAPQMASKEITASGVLRLEGAADKNLRGLGVSVKADLVRGRGPVIAQAEGDGLLLGATTQLDLVQSTVDSVFQLAIHNFSGLSHAVPALKDAGGVLSATGSARGPFTRLTLGATLEAHKLRYAERSVELATATVSGGLGPQDILKASGHVVGVTLQPGATTPWDITAVDFTAQGHSPQWRPDLTIRFRNASRFQFAGVFTQAAKGWKVAWDQLGFTPDKGAAIANTQPGFAQGRPDGAIEVQSLALSNGQGSLELPSAVYRKNAIQAHLLTKRLALEPLVKIVLPKKVIQGTLDADVQLSGAPRSPSGNVTLKLTDAKVQQFAFKQFDLAAQLGPPWIQVQTLVLQMTEGKKDVEGQGKLPMHLLDPSQPDLPVDFTLHAPDIDLKIFTANVPAIVVDKKARAALEMHVTGRFPDISAEGSLRADIEHLVVKPAGLDLHDVHADVRSHAKDVEIQQFVARTKKGDISITGKSTLPALNFTVRGKDVMLNIPKQLDARLDLGVLISGDLDGPDVSGDIVIQNATYTQPKSTKKDKQKEKEDRKAAAQQERLELTTGQGSQSSVWEATTMNVHAQWPRSVWYRDGLSKIETSGDIRVQKDEDTSAIYMSGRIGLVRGSYDAYGRDFVLNSGDIIFTGPPDINPSLNLEAQYTSGGTVVYLDVTGTAKKPELKMRSNPPLSEQDIISVLVLGQPLNQVGPGQASETSKSQQAQALAGSVVSSYLTKQLRESGMDVVGLDVVRVEPTTGGNRLTVGRYVGEKLFVSYGQPLQSGASRVFDANYYLSKYWTVLGETGSGTDSHMDLQFRLPLNQPKVEKPQVQVPAVSSGTAKQ